MQKRDTELKSHCLQIAQRLESGNSFQPHNQPQQSFNQRQPLNTQPAFTPTPNVQTQSAFQPQQNIKQQQFQPQVPPQQQFGNQGNFTQVPKQHTTNTVIKNKVFIVHGHDELAKEQIARFVSQVGLEPIILHEQASSSRTIIEKIEKYAAQVCFAVVLYTPCDQGSKNGDRNQLPRARQNVVFEHGYFIGRIG
jgi:predicted nucleotide-binding protein